jgi:hypothetical protein
MRCPDCGHDNPGGNKFCASCGKPLAEATVQMPRVPPVPPEQHQPTTVLPAAVSDRPVAAPIAAPVATPVYAPVAPGKTPMKRSTKVAIVVIASVVGLCAIAAAIIIPLSIAAANKPVAEINSVRLVRTDGDTLDIGKVPLDTEVAVKVGYRSRFKDNGSGTLKIVVADSEGESLFDKSFDLTSSDKTQTKEYKFTMSQGSGKPLKATASLDVSQGSKKLKADKALSFTMVEGKGAELQLEEATNAATEKCREATEALKAAGAAGISITDLADRLSGALTDLKNANTAEEANAVTATAQGVIDECNARLAAADQAKKNVDTCRQNQSVIRAKLVDWWTGSGNFPDSMSQLYGIPACPSGGTYTYNAPDTTPASLTVSCSVHGAL